MQHDHLPRRARRARRLLLGLLVALGGWHCEGFVELESLRCGNGIIEPVADEDCDGLPADATYRCGQPGTVGACRVICEDSPCPPGWRCGLDNVCRASRNELTAPVVSRLDGQSLDLADVDGDGLLDVVTNQRDALGLGFGRGDGSFEVVPAVTTPVAERKLAVGDIDADGRADVLLPTLTEVLVLRGSEERTLRTVVTPADDAHAFAQLSLRAISPFTSDLVLSFSSPNEAGSPVLLDRPLDTSAVDALFPEGVNILARAGQLDPVDVPSAEEVVITHIGADVVHVLRLECAPDCALTLAATRTLPNRRQVLPGGAFLADLDLDGWPDLIVQVGAGGTYPILVAFGTPDGLGEFVELANVDTSPPRPLAQVVLGNINAIVDIVGDPRPDLVSPAAVFAIEGPARDPQASVVWTPEIPLNRVQVVDLDGDGALDLVGTGRESSLQAAYGRGPGEFLPRVIDFQPTIDFDVGDLDGDRRLDIVSLRQGAIAEVRFGQPAGDLTAPVHLGALGGERHAVILARLPGDATDSVLVKTTTGRYIFRGNPERRPVAPLTVEDTVRAVAVGRFFGESSSGYLLESRSEPMAGVVHHLFADGGETLRAISTTACDGTVPDGSGRSLAVDIDGDGHDELIRMHLIQGRQLRSVLVVLRIGADEVTCERAPALGTNYIPTDLRAADVDLDGRPDVVALLDRPIGPREDPYTLVAWPWTDDGPGSPIALEIPKSYEQIATLDLGEGPRLVLIGEGTAQLVSLTDGPTFTDLGRVVSAVLEARAADLDGDGIEDLVLKTATSVLTYRQATCSARQAWDGACERAEAW